VNKKIKEDEKDLVESVKMKMNTFIRKLESLSACREAVEWAKEQKSPHQAWLECDHPDWLFWLAREVGIDNKILVRVACDCVERALQYIPRSEKQVWEAVESARRWCNEKCSLKEVRAAADDAYAAYVAYGTSVVSYAAYAAYVIASNTAAAVTYAAYAAAYTAAFTAYDAAYDDAKKQMSKIIRKRIKWNMIEKTFNIIAKGTEI